MSIQLSSGLGMLGATLQASDGRALRSDYTFDFAGKNNQSRPFQDGILWAKSKGIGQQSIGYSDLLGGEFGRFENDQQDVLGGSQAKKLIGTTRDSSGNPLGSCVVEGFVTATDVSVGKVTSDSGGYFELPTMFSGAHYLVAYQAGSPDVAGTTKNNLIPV